MISPSEKVKMNNQIKYLQNAVANLRECNEKQGVKIKALEQQLALMSRAKQEDKPAKKSKE